MDTQALVEELSKRVSGEVRFDQYSRILYSTDASIYQIEPIGVVIPRNREDVIATVEAAHKYQVPLLPRGGGTSLAGQTVGHALVMDFSKYMNQVLEVNTDEAWVRTQPGIVVDELNHQLRPHNLMFAPDPATSNRANVGGLLGNNSCGSHSILYGKTMDNVREIDAVLSNGDQATFGPIAGDTLEAKLRGDSLEASIYRGVLDIVERNREEVDRRYPTIMRRVSGYNLDDLVRGQGLNLARLLVGSEGTLATTVEAKLHLVPRPNISALAVLHFRDIIEAMEATVETLQEAPSAVELVDKFMLDMTRASTGYARRMTFVEGDPAAILLVEFYGDSEAELASRLDNLEERMRRANLGYAVRRFTDPAEQANVWTVRKAAVGLMMGVKSDLKPLPFVEDTAVSPEKLPEYVRRFTEIVQANGTYCAYYGHASVGCLHIRPMINLKLQEGVDRMSSIASEISDLVLEFGGAMSGEHGDGLVRSVWNEKMFGPTIYNALRELKKTFDPTGIMNPGKIVDSPPMTENLRYGPAYRTLGVTPQLDFSADGSFASAVELCNGMGACRKTLEGTMCPSYMATREEEHSTRGRANALRAAISGKLPADALTSKRLYDVLDLCLECKGCKAECPSNVDMAKIKYEFLDRYFRANGLPLRNRLFGNIAAGSRWGSFFAPFSNWLLGTNLVKGLLDRYVGIDRRRNLPAFAPQSFEQWFRARSQSNGRAAPTRGKVALFHDTFTNYNHPEAGMAAVELLERLGYEVVLADRKCCGRPMISKGMLDAAKRNARYNVNSLHRYVEMGMKVVGLEPSCILTFRDDYLDMLPGDEKAQQVAQNTLLLDEFLQQQFEEGSMDLKFKETNRRILLHGHCHQKALVGTGSSIQMLRLIPGAQVEDTNAGCCGMAGSFGFEKEHYDVSMAIGEQKLFPAIRSQQGDFDVVASGISCRQQIEAATGKKPKHLAEILAECLSD